MAEPAKKKEEEDPQVVRDRIMRAVVKEWNTLVNSLSKASDAWDRYCQLRQEHDVNIEEFPPECQRVLVLANPRGDLDFIIEDMITRGNDWKTYLKTQLIKV